MVRPLSPDELQAFRRDGFVIVRGAFSPKRVRDLRETVEKLLDRAAAAEDAGEEGPLVPKVNWINREKRLHSRMGDYLMPAKFDPLYIEWLAEDCYDHLSQLIDGGTEHGVRHCRFQMLCGGDGQPYKQNWHRDWQGWDPHNNGGEEGTFGANFKHIEWNSPLIDDDHFLNVVPGSHIRRSTREERAVCLSGLLGDVDREMPGGIAVRVNPGDVVYFDAGILHRGWNPLGLKRWTLHNVTWGSQVPILFDYDPVGDVPGLKQVLAANPSLPAKGRRYLTDFIDSVESGQRAVRRPLFADLWTTPEQADAWAAEKAAVQAKAKTPAAAAAAKPRL